MKATALLFLTLPALLSAGPQFGGAAASAAAAGGGRGGGAAASASTSGGWGLGRKKRETVEDEIAALESRLSDLYNLQDTEAVMEEGESERGRGIFDSFALRAAKAYGKKRCRIITKELSGRKLAIFKSACKAVKSASSLDEIKAIVFKAFVKICPADRAAGTRESGKGAALDDGCRQVADYAADN